MQNQTASFDKIREGDHLPAAHDQCALRQKRRRQWHVDAISPISPAFETSSKRRKGFPSEARVKRGLRIVHGNIVLAEKLGRNDLCPCGSGRKFQTMLPDLGLLLMAPGATIIGANEGGAIGSAFA